LEGVKPCPIARRSVAHHGTVLICLDPQEQRQLLRLTTALRWQI